MKKKAGQVLRSNILVVDDEVEITNMLTRHLKFLGYDADGINDPFKAFKMIEKENYNIIITDIVMPGMDGLDLLRQIKRHDGGIQVIMMTGYVTMHNILTAMRLGAETVFFKPLKDLDKLENAVVQCIDKVKMWQAILKELGSIPK